MTLSLLLTGAILLPLGLTQVLVYRQARAKGTLTPGARLGYAFGLAGLGIGTACGVAGALLGGAL